MLVRFQGQEDPLKEGMTTHSSILAWRIPWTEEPGRLQSMGSQRVGHNWSNWAWAWDQFIRNCPTIFFVWLVGFLFFLIYFTLQYCIGFAIHQHESTMVVHVFPILNPLPPPSPYHPSGSSQCTSPKHPVSCTKPRLAIRFLYDIVHVSMPNNF